MTDRSVFSDDEWKALTEAPLLVSLAMVAVGEHGPISMVKEAAASARTVTHPPACGPADELITEIAREAESREARHDVRQHRGKSLDEVVEGAMADLGAAATALRKLPPDEAAQIGNWFVDIAKAVAAAAKTVTPAEQATIDRIAELFGVASDRPSA
ncbi:MAG TPA: hypothetical protein VEM59_00390 [Acidimicrobiia bacterium]|nr:hypothetical protein [Acidimicrobiia bacterium]